MIVLTKLNGDQFVLNAELIRTMDATPDTNISLINGDRFMVRESLDEVIEKVYEYKRLLRSLVPTV